MLMRDLRAKTKPELLKLIEDYKAELFMLRFRNSTGQLKETHKINDIRKEIAKVFTVLNAEPTVKSATKKSLRSRLIRQPKSANLKVKKQSVKANTNEVKKQTAIKAKKTASAKPKVTTGKEQ